MVDHRAVRISYVQSTMDQVRVRHDNAPSRDKQ